MNNFDLLLVPMFFGGINSAVFIIKISQNLQVYIAIFWIFKVFDSGIQCMQRNSLQRNLQKRGIDCNVTAFVSGLRCTLSKTAVHRIPLQKFIIPTFGTVMVYVIRRFTCRSLCWITFHQRHEFAVQNYCAVAEMLLDAPFTWQLYELFIIFVQ